MESQQMDVSLSTIAARLRDERKRLGMTQETFAEVSGAKRRTLVDWEKGVSSPTATQLSALGSINVDLLYVLTGHHLGQGVCESEQEVTLVRMFRNLSASQKEVVLLLITELAAKN
ncbi:helix-turn-helix domain-containing protein [Chromobacterium haemolyticum]|uniref:Helix-turn-helix domain-containing protein n=1 Tax=Chromobacterium fluminis TaxID=3044269 RepID=A0ABX0L9C3_9NEIS|nr:helix-turn-helix domain-containing protein [Chromobacterium haemolyticum]NHR07385.1 helix-turn-helix domain-containing protein [Chromobacterium haemolyticum]